MKLPERFSVYTARVSFFETDYGKIRPVIVVSEPFGLHDIVAVVPISSRPSQVDVDFQIQKLDEAGLVRPSSARVHRLTTVLASDLSRKLGALSSADRESIQKALRKYFDL